MARRIGRRRARRFPTEDAARAFDDALAEVSPAARRSDTARHGRSGGVYSYRTADGVRWRFVYRRSDGTQTTKRGFMSERAARDARRRLIEQVERGEVATRRRPSAAIGSGGLPGGGRISNPAPGAAMRSPAASGWCPRSACAPSASCPLTTSGSSSPTWPRRSRLASWPRRRSTTRSGPSSCASTRPSTTGCSRSTRRCGFRGSRRRTSSATTSDSMRSRATSMGARTSTVRWPSS